MKQCGYEAARVSPEFIWVAQQLNYAVWAQVSQGLSPWVLSVEKKDYDYAESDD